MSQQPLPTAADVDQAQRLLTAGKLEDAQELIENVLGQAPDDSDAQYTFAVIQRLNGCHTEALGPVSYTHLTLPTTPYV